MKYISIDIETTGLSPENNQILSIGAIVEDSKNPLAFDKIPKFHAAIIRKSDITGSLFALNMNSGLIGTISEYQNAKEERRKEIEDETGMMFYEEYDIVENFFRFLWDNKIAQDSFPVDWFMRGQMVRIDKEGTYPSVDSKLPITYLNVAGKNFGTFDLKFLEKLPRWKQIFKVRQRILDPAILYVDWNNDESLPSLDECKARAEISGEISHNAIEDAWECNKNNQKILS